ncbi:MAG: 3-methyl-2-oxobutanoate hydroxymethyltransferase, partial [Candidatus Geothermarchaeales archaeon]
LGIPTIGIGAGPYCDGQVLVLHDLVGLYQKFKPKFAKRYADIGEEIRNALVSFRSEVYGGSFPAEQHTFHMKEDQRAKPERRLATKSES